MNKLDEILTKCDSIKREICDTCGVRTATLWNWRNGVSKPALIYQEKINEIFIRNFNCVIFE